MKYKLTFWQKLWLPFTWLFWKLTVVDNKKSWHEMKKGMEKHKCNFTIPYHYRGYNFLQCDHEGCYTVELID